MGSLDAPRPLMTAQQVAALFCHSVDWFYRNRNRLERAGFPPPAAGTGNRWDPAAIAAWQDSQVVALAS